MVIKISFQTLQQQGGKSQAAINQGGQGGTLQFHHALGSSTYNNIDMPTILYNQTYLTIVYTFNLIALSATPTAC